MYLKGPYQKQGRGWQWFFIVVIVVITLVLFSREYVIAKSETNKLPPAKKPLSPKVVIIDPGHGGSDPGACREGVQEKDINLAIAKKIGKQLPNYRVQLTRIEDTDFVKNGVFSKAAERQDLAQRIEVAKKANAKIFVSIHINTGKGQDRGALVYYDPMDKASTRLAEIMQEEVNKLPGTIRKKPRPEQFYLFENLQIPVVLVEAGWLCSPGERERLQNPQYQEQMAGAIARGINKFLQAKE